MQHGLVDNGLNRAVLAHGMHTPASDYHCQSAETVSTHSTAQISYQSHLPRHFPPSPASTASTASDQSEHCERSNVSQSEKSEYGHQSPADSPPASQELQQNGAVYGRGYLSRLVTSLSTEAPSNTHHQFNYDQYRPATTKLRGLNNDSNNNSNNGSNSSNNYSNSNNSNNNNNNQGHARSLDDETLHGQKQESEAAHLAYRTKSENVSAPVTSCARNGKPCEDALVQSKQEFPSHNVAPSSREGSVEPTTSRRCFPGIFNIFSGVASSQATLAPSPQNVQTNSRRRTASSAAPPPRLRRDTDSTDTIVKMIVIFCTNLIQSIWPVDNVSTASTCNTGAQSGGNVLPLQVFITETLRRSKTSYSTLQIALFYLILLKQCLPELACPGQSGQPGCRAMLCGRRMFLTALILASKYLQDRNYSARAWSKISGLPMKEINDNERRYLRFVSWDLHVPKEAFENWSKIVLAICRLSTGQDLGGKDSDHPPSPGAGSMPHTNKQAQPSNTCSNNQLYIVRSWWTFNLHGLCTDLVRCPRRTEQYLLSIPQLKVTSALPRPLLENKPSECMMEYAHEEALSSTQDLSKPPSVERVGRVSRPVGAAHISASSTMPPPPPVLGTLPTPQTTPRFDVASMWKSNSSRSSSRCRDSASLLGGIDRPCPMANAEKLPASKYSLPPPTSLSGTSLETKPSLSQPSPTTWSQPSFKARQVLPAPDRSLTSSPESVISDLSSLSGFVWRSRTSSFSSTSSRSTMPLPNPVASDAERCEGFKRQLISLDELAAFRVQDWTRANDQKDGDQHLPQTLSRPQTAFRTSIIQSGAVPVNSADTESVIDEGYCSGDHARDSQEDKRKQPTMDSLLDLKLLEQTNRAMTALRNRQNCKPMIPRPSLVRSNTQVYASGRHTAGSSHQTLKRSRSESFECNTEPACVSEPAALGMASTRTKDVQLPWQPWAASRQPVQCQTQDKNKRIAVQSPAATRASANLRKEACAWLRYHNHIRDAAEAESHLVADSQWQKCARPLQEFHI